MRLNICTLYWLRVILDACFRPVPNKNNKTLCPGWICAKLGSAVPFVTFETQKSGAQYSVFGIRIFHVWNIQTDQSEICIHLLLLTFNPEGKKRTVTDHHLDLERLEVKPSDHETRDPKPDVKRPSWW